MNNILSIGHRGAKGYAPENTLLSFQKALDLGVAGIELDVHLTADGEIVVIHDETIDRTTNEKGIVNQLSLAAIKKLRIDGEHEIPTLKEVLDLVNQHCFVNIELKGNGTAGAVVALIEHYVLEKNWQYSDFLLSSFNWNGLQEVAFLNANIPLGVLAQSNLDLAFAFSKFIKAKAIHPYFHLLDTENTTQMQERGFLVFPWTVNEIEDIQKIKSYPINGIITDFPDRI